MILQPDNLRVVAPRGHAIVQDVSFGVHPGEHLALLGESGSGKSMTARAMLALPPAGVKLSGRVLLGGVDLLSLPRRALQARRGKDIAMVFQEPALALNPVQRIGAQIAEVLAIHGMTDPVQRAGRVSELLGGTGLSRSGVGAERYPHELSGGQRQRVALAIALAMKPKVVIADEPTSALDSVAAAQVLSLLFDLVDESGAALILITHDLALAQKCSRTLVMDRGRLVEDRATPELIEAPASPAAKALMGARSLALPAHPKPGRESVLTVSHLNAWVGRTTLVRDVSFEVRDGERLAFVGGSGAGKTSLMRAVLGLIPSRGEVRLRQTRPVSETAEPPADAPRARSESAARTALRRKVQIVFQDPATSFNPRHSIRRIVTEPLFHTTVSRQEADAMAGAALEQVGLSRAMLERKPHAFSGGQRQRIAIARALIAQPEILVADEAVSALDAALRADIVQLLDSLVTQGRVRALLFIAHDMALVEQLADRLAVMHRGELVEIGPTSDILANPVHPATRALIAAAR